MRARGTLFEYVATLLRELALAREAVETWTRHARRYEREMNRLTAELAAARREREERR